MILQKSLEKYRVDAEKWVYEEDRREDYAWEHLAKEIKDLVRIYCR